MTYQDRIDDEGAVLAPGYRSCEDRYALIRRAMHGIRWPFTVLDLGAASGYFSIRLTRDFAARCVAVDRSAEVKEAEGRVAAVVQGDLDLERIRRQGTFDVILALSLLHHQRDWLRILDLLVAHTRSALIVETPHPSEKLKQAVARHQLGDIEEALRAAGMVRIGSSPGVWNHELQRGLWMLRKRGIPISGKVESGSGSNGALLPRFQHEVAGMLGYTPYPGSVNLRTSRIFRLGAYAMEYVDPVRGRGGKRGGDYQIWHATIDGYDGPCHVMRPGVRGHGRDMLELWAPVRLRDVLEVDDGDTITVRIGA
jgi:CTP-dependent riboflavin kinase